MVIFGPFVIETGSRSAMLERVVNDTENDLQFVRTVVYTGVEGMWKEK